MHQVKMLQRNKMSLRDKMSQFMGIISHTTHQEKLKHKKKMSQERPAVLQGN
jgi:hypothetical protein